MPESSRDEFAATWRDCGGEIVARSYGGTVCWFPRFPGRLRIERDGYVHIVPCRDCPGCFEFARRRLASRLLSRYSEYAGELFYFRIYTHELEHAYLSKRLHRNKRFQLERGFWRLGPGSFALLVRERAPLAAELARRGLPFKSYHVHRGRGRRAYYGLCSGVLVGRKAYGDNINRWYSLGLPKAEKETWTVSRITYEPGYERARSPRAWKKGNVVLVPPELWAMSRVDRRRLRMAVSGLRNPEGVARVASLLRTVTTARNLQSSISPSDRTALTREQVQQFYRDQLARKECRERERASADLIPPPFLGGGYNTSGLDRSVELSADQWRESNNQHRQEQRKRGDQALVSQLESLFNKMRERTGEAMPEAAAALEKLKRRRTTL